MKRYHIFKDPYVLIEDTTGQHKPFHKEYQGQPPNLNLLSAPMCCPFTDKKLATPKKKRKNKVEFCETCYVKITDYDKHIIDPEHREYARDEAHYEQVDAIIKEFEYIKRPVSPCDRFMVIEERGFEQLCEEETVLYVEKMSGNVMSIGSGIDMVVDEFFK